MGGDDGNFEIYAELPPITKGSYSFLRNPRLLKTSELLYYPLEDETESPCSFFMGITDTSMVGSTTDKRFIRCQLEISPKFEREKHDNPLELNVKPGTAELLAQLPAHISHEIISHAIVENQVPVLISNAIYELYSAQAKKTVNKELLEQTEKAKQKLSDIENDVQKTQQHKDEIVDEINQLLNQKSDLEHINQQLSQDELFKRQTIVALIKQCNQLENDMNNKIKRLKSYLEDKATFLKTFEFIDEEDLDNFLIEHQSHQQATDDISFTADLNGNYQAAVSYIQAHLVKNDILYPRHIIENYLTLLRTKDLIILAGDSGSGKTNLVKSFAKAVGGKSIIVPVKPNWTSSD